LAIVITFNELYNQLMNKLIVLLLLFATPLFASEGDFFYGLGFGAGNGKMSDNTLRIFDDYSRDPKLYPAEQGFNIQLQLGYVLLHDFRPGLMIESWSRNGTLDFDHLLLTPVVTWFPKQGDFYIRPGVGIGLTKVDYLERGDWHRKMDFGSAWNCALGYVFRFDGMEIGPQFIYSGSMGKDLEVWASHYSLMLEFNWAM
jgi:hypothetical protein